MSQKFPGGKQSLIDEGKRILINEGYKNLSIRKLASKCEIGTGTFYNYFNNKDEMVEEIFKEDWLEILGNIEKLKYSSIPFKEKLYEIYLDVYDFVNNYGDVFHEIIFSRKNNLHKNKNIIQQIYIKLGQLIDLESSKDIININIASEKIAYIIIQNFIFISRDKYIHFDEFYISLNL